ncbi:MAG TPA: hypothetical protein VNO33_18290 [Kofleriaceae bacterium]|nr:hypothetical protein [Kofleriaceae bacterium]
MYRFGDGTPFPLRENFIETLVAAVDCCVAIYKVEAQVEEHHARVRDASRRADDEIRRLDALNGLIETALAPLVAHKDTGRASEQAAARIFEAAGTIIRNSRTGVARKRETSTHEILSPSVREAVPVALGRFFCKHQLPRTEWNAHWKAGVEGPATADLNAQASRALELVFRATFAADSFWSRAIPMAELFGAAPVTATVDAGKGRARQLRLDPMILTEVQVGPGREAMVLRASTKRPCPGLHILMPRPGEAGPLVVSLDKRDQSRGQPFYLDEIGAGAVIAAWRALERELPQLVAGRNELVTARLSGRDVSEIEHPGQLAEVILMSLATIVREMRMRSRVPGELILKRDLAADRREEMFVPRQVLWNKLSVLSPRHRQLFEAIGLSNEATYEFVTRVSEKAVRPRQRAPLPAGAEKQPDLPTMESFGFERDPAMIDTGRTRSSPPTPQPGQPAAAPASTVRDDAGEDSDDGEGVSEVEVTNPRGEETSEVVSGIIERASA